MPSVFGAMKEKENFPAVFAPSVPPLNVKTEPFTAAFHPFGAMTVNLVTELGAFTANLVVGEPAQPCSTVNVTVAGADGLIIAGDASTWAPAGAANTSVPAAMTTTIPVTVASFLARPSERQSMLRRLTQATKSSVREQKPERFGQACIAVRLWA